MVHRCVVHTCSFLMIACLSSDAYCHSLATSSSRSLACSTRLSRGKKSYVMPRTTPHTTASGTAMRTCPHV
jgi:hypothetical protein